ncbi:hypothetical protein [Lentzea sp. E54]|uniref:hypothetical protein n=1 Tax=Lentzea xerophila TaxID=3435883 RepID=UPI003DA65860
MLTRILPSEPIGTTTDCALCGMPATPRICTAAAVKPDPAGAAGGVAGVGR